MPRFAAHLAYLFTERPFIERFGAAAAAGFRAVELQFPYDHAPPAVKAELDRYGLTMLGINTPAAMLPGGVLMPSMVRRWRASSAVKPAAAAAPNRSRNGRSVNR